jgi:phosphatidylserine decarboxylase
MKAFKTFFFAWLFPWVPKRLLSRLTGVIMRMPIPGPLRGAMNKGFAKFFKIAAEEAEHQAAHYGSFDAFFTRKLKPGARVLKGTFIHPVDGKITEQGEVKSGELIQAKGWTYPLGEFLGDELLAKAYEGGSFATYYLCPADYHRVHAPLAGNLVSARHIPGMLWPVNEWSVTNIRRLFNLNERVVMNFQTPEGRWSLVMVGATNVGHITVSLDPSISTNKWMWHAPTERRYTPEIPVKAGDELGIFHLGSTVICVYEKTMTRPPKTQAKAVRFGENALQA